jgi:hypothetical protein
LIAAWRLADTNDRITIERQLVSWRGPAGSARERLQATALSLGDTLTAFLQASENLRFTQEIDSTDVAFVLPFLADAGPS